MDQQQDVTRMIGAHAAAAAQGAEEVRQHFSTVARTVEAAGTLTDQVFASTSDLATRIEELKQASGEFVRRLRAA